MKHYLLNSKKCVSLFDLMVLALLLFLLPATGHGQIFSLEELIHKAENNDELIRIYQLDKKVASLQKSNIRRSYLPSLNLNAGYSHQSEIARLSLPFAPGTTIEAGVYDQYNLSGELNVFLFDGLKRYYQIRQVNTLINEKAYQQEYRKKEIRFYITDLAYQYMLQKALLQSLQASQKRLMIQKKRILSLYLTGFSSSLDTLEIVNRLNELQVQMDDISGNIRDILIELKTVCHIDSIDSISIPTETTPQISAMHQNAIENNYNLRLLNFRKQALNFKLKQNIELFLPKIYLTFGYHHAKPGVNFFENQWMNYWTFGVRLQWNLFRWGIDVQNRKIDKLQYNQLLQQIRLTSKQILIQAEKLHNQLQTLQQKLHAYQQILEIKKEKYDLVKKQWEQGQKSTLDLLDAEQEYTTTDFRKHAVAIQIQIIKLAIERVYGFNMEY